MAIENIIEKVRKLRALAANAGTLAEAEAAAAQAEAIIARYRLEEAQLEIDDASRVEGVGVADEPLWAGGERVPSWLGWLANALARHYGCLAFTDIAHGPAGLTKVFKIVGRPSDVQVVRYMFAWLSAEIDRLSYRERGRSAMNAFRLGAVDGICGTLTAAQKNEEAARSHEPPTTAPVLPLNPRSTDRRPRGTWAEGLTRGRSSVTFRGARGHRRLRDPTRTTAALDAGVPRSASGWP